MKPAGSEYTCEECGGTFARVQDDAAANTEAAREFGVTNASEDPQMAIVCDDCYREIMAWRRETA